MESLKEILILTDFSPISWRALKYAVLFQTNYQSNLSILHVIPSRPGIAPPDDEISFLKQKLINVGLELNDGGIKSFVRVGNVANEIKSFVKEFPFDMVIMGINGNGGLSPEVGKHTYRLLEQSDIPVLVLPNSPSGQLASIPQF